MNSETAIKIMLIICVLTLAIIALSKREQRIIQTDPISQRIEAVKEAFPYDDTDSKNRRAELIERIINEK